MNYFISYGRRTSKTHEYRAKNCSKSICERKYDITHGLKQIHWKMLDEFNIHHNIRYKDLKVYKKDNLFFNMEP